ncbi:MAG: hypothetical protein QXT64_00120 [Desulfurococcaceae archaeon]|uniref:Uncharacterized protein n=1 Tax=Ligamenvirales sp. TaxID=2832923 RepID=A0AAU6PX87_9VIRU
MPEYEYIFDMVELLKDKPLDAARILEAVAKPGFKPLAVKVDNERGQVVFYFSNPLGREEKSDLDLLVKKIFQEWKKRA